MNQPIDESTKAFGFVNLDAEALYKAMLIIADENFQNDLLRVMDPKIIGEERAYYSGRISATNDILRLYQANREFMNKVREGKQTNPNQNG
jgi:hypothetical protein